MAFGGRYFKFRDENERAAQIPIPLESDTTYLRERKRIETWNGTEWVRTFWTEEAGATGVSLRRVALQSIPNNTATAISWDTAVFDSDTFVPLKFNGDQNLPFDTITIPAGLAGLYACSAKFTGAVGDSIIRIQRNGTRFVQKDVGALASHTFCSATVQLAVGDTVNAVVFHTVGVAQNYSAGLFEMWRIGR
jgi:hypothetical protein